MYKKICTLFLIILCISCTQTKESGIETLTVHLTENNPSIYDLFSKVELIPLATNDSCLIEDIERITLTEDNMYIFDGRRKSLYVFDPDGHFIRRIARKGNGPGEYQMLSDVFIDKDIALLDPMGFIRNYDIHGKFLNIQELPVKPNYQSIVLLGEDKWALWSCLDKEDECISVLNKSDSSPISSYWKDDRMLNMGILKPFYVYNGKTYFSTAYRNQVYELTPDSLKTVYQWDFGKDNIKESLLSEYMEIENPSKRNEQILSDLESGILSYSMDTPNQTNHFYYTCLQRGVGIDAPKTHVFYKKADGTSYVFKRFREGISLNPLYFCDNYTIAKIPSSEYNQYKMVLSNSDFATLQSREEDENPCLVRLHFK